MAHKVSCKVSLLNFIHGYIIIYNYVTLMPYQMQLVVTWYIKTNQFHAKLNVYLDLQQLKFGKILD